MPAPRHAEPRPRITGGTGPQAIWDALEHYGASSIQAAAIMGNMIAESSLNPESHAMDTNGYESYGLISWNAGSYPNASSLVTGNPARDIAAQIKFLAQTGGFAAAKGSTIREAAGNFAQNYERCATCQPGGTSYDQRQANAATVAGWASSGNWPQSSGQGSDQATLTSAQTAELTATCAVGFSGFQTGIPSWVPGIGTGQGHFCLLSRSQARALLGTGIMAAGMVMMLPGLSLLATAAALRVVQPALATVNRVPVVGSYSRAATAAVSKRASYQRP